MQTRPYIIYYTEKEGERKITVIDGQPFYQSTGVNSKTPGIWYPFHMLRGHIALTDKHLANVQCISEEGITHLKKVTNGQVKDKKSGKQASSIYIIKYSAKHVCQTSATTVINKQQITITNDITNSDQSYEASRMPTKETLIISAKLSGGEEGIENQSFNIVLHLHMHQYSQIKISSKEFEDAKVAIQFNHDPDCITNNPDRVNLWLWQQGAMVLTQLAITEEEFKQQSDMTEVHIENARILQQKNKLAEQKRAEAKKHRTKPRTQQTGQSIIDDAFLEFRLPKPDELITPPLYTSSQGDSIGLFSASVKFYADMPLEQRLKLFEEKIDSPLRPKILLSKSSSEKVTPNDAKEEINKQKKINKYHYSLPFKLPTLSLFKKGKKPKEPKENQQQYHKLT